ncbi:hypothetical protein ABVY47_004477 [Vibrio parahaemolyticus]|nr:hypothetical protein [Vibrio cholerae]EJC6794241.1 hypothetical protein [Vibrio parahaemolyticus]EGQ9441052.1 hypothetical protein [Vibrio cholerae]EGQ9854623.1 hypothetical protein [Vibrio cholerae]EGR0311329.1 hypothetical protein [Vibrio cholerae]
MVLDVCLLDAFA